MPEIEELADDDDGSQTSETSDEESRPRWSTAEAGKGAAKQDPLKPGLAPTDVFSIILVAICLVLCAMIKAGFWKLGLGMGIPFWGYALVWFTQPWISLSDGIERTPVLMRRYHFSPKAQLQGAEALFRLTQRKRSGDRERLFAASGAELLLDSTGAYPESAELHARALGAMMHMASPPEHRAALEALGVLEWALHALTVHGAADKTACKYGLLLLSCLVDGSDRRKALAVHNGSIEAVAAVMDAHRLDPEIQKWGCMTLFNNTMECAAARRGIGDRGGIGAVAAGMLAHINAMEVQRMGTALLGAALHHSDTVALSMNLPAAKECRAFKAQRLALRAYPKCKEIQAVGALVMQTAAHAGRIMGTSFVVEEGDEDEDEAPGPEELMLGKEEDEEEAAGGDGLRRRKR